MSKEKMIEMLESIGADKNTIKAMCNAFDLGVQWSTGMIALKVINQEDLTKQ